MGQMRFVAPRKEQLPEGAIDLAYLAGIEGIPWRSRNWWTTENGIEPAEFVIERQVCESGNLFVPWCFEEAGEVVLSTASLMERDKPYDLLLELARGTVNRVRNQLAEWEGMGLQVPLELEMASKEMATAFSRAATSFQDQSSTSRHALDAIRLALIALDSLTSAYSTQAIASRRTSTATLPTFFAGRLDSRGIDGQEAEYFNEAFNSAMINFRWAELEPHPGTYSWERFDQQLDWCHNHGLRIVAGPLLQFDRHHLPDWLYGVEGNFPQLQACVVRHVRAILERYRGKVHVWNCAARMNLEGPIKLSEEDRLRLVVGAIDEVQRLDARTPYIISFDRPWAEYLSTADHDFSPLHFADSLVRADLGLAGIALEMNFGYWPLGTLPRDHLEVSRQLDRWNLLGLPLLLQTTVPSSSENDPLARAQVHRTKRCFQGAFTNLIQQQGAERLALLSLAKSFVHGFIWNELSDAVPHEFAHGGLLDSRGHPKPALKALSDLRQQFLS